MCGTHFLFSNILKHLLKMCLTFETATQLLCILKHELNKSTKLYFSHFRWEHSALENVNSSPQHAQTLMVSNKRAYKTAEHFEQRITKVHVCAACRAASVLTNTLNNYFQGSMSLSESFLNIKVGLSEDKLETFKVLWLLCQEVLFLCFVLLACFALHCWRRW